MVPSFRIALDVEGVLSNTRKATFERSDKLDMSMLRGLNGWDFPTEEMAEAFHHTSANLWHNHHEEIPPISNSIDWASYALQDYGHTVDIVTHRRGQDDGIKAWLDDHDVRYERFRSISEPKDDLDYHVYVDDKPQLAERIAESDDKVIALIDGRINRHVEESLRVSRFDNLEWVALAFTDDSLVENVAKLVGENQ